MKTLEICIHCFNYQRRLTWLLSSILQQRGEIPDITISLAYTPDNGNPKTEDVIKLFRDKGLKIIDVILKPDQIQCRSFGRNIRTKDTTADWILFVDCDMVYHPDFFADLKVKLESDKYKNEDKVLGADRFSLNDQFCIEYFEKEDKYSYPCVIDNVVDIVSKFPVKWVRGKHNCAGYFQLARVEAIRSKNQVYSGRNRDVWRNTKSDREFRIRMGGRVPLDTLPQYHLNHDRQGPEIQR